MYDLRAACRSGLSRLGARRGPRRPDATYFITLVLAEQGTASGAGALRRHFGAFAAAWREVRRHRPFHCDAIVVLPDHLHCIWTLPPGDGDQRSRWRRIEAGLRVRLAAAASRARGHRAATLVWPGRYWAHALRDTSDYQRQLDYIHFDPVRHGWSQRASEWPYSSFARFVAGGFYPTDWAGAAAARPTSGPGGRCAAAPTR